MGGGGSRKFPPARNECEKGGTLATREGAAAIAAAAVKDVWKKLRRVLSGMGPHWRKKEYLQSKMESSDGDHCKELSRPG